MGVIQYWVVALLKDGLSRLIFCYRTWIQVFQSEYILQAMLHGSLLTVASVGQRGGG